MTAHLVLTDGTTEVDLISSEWGFHLSGWEPAISQYKGGGYFADSPLADGRRLVDRKFANITETFDLKLNDVNQDQLIRTIQEARRLIEKAAAYWASDWQNEPVWLEARATQETNTRYSIVHMGTIAIDDDPYQMPFLQPDCRSVMDGLILSIEHEPFWRADEPGTGTCVPTAGYVLDDRCDICFVEFDGADTDIVVGDNAAIQDLHDAAFTVEAWIRADSEGESNQGVITIKGTPSLTGWSFTMNTNMRIHAVISCATTDAEALSQNNGLVAGQWYHVAFTWDDASYNYPRLWINGVEATYSSTANRNGAIVTDVGSDLYIGEEVVPGGLAFDGGIGWLRISDTVRYNAAFTAPARCTLPTVDGNTVGQWIGAECSGATIDNQEGTAALDGTLTDGDFDCDCYISFGSVSGDVADPTCEDEVYIANKRNEATLSNVHYYDASLAAWSPNLLNAAFPYDLLPAVPANNDVLYFGIDITDADSGPFCSLVLNLQTAAVYAGAAASTWQYWNGAWQAFAANEIQDNTNAAGAMTGDALDTAGVGSVHWEVQSDWVTNDPGVGVTGYWVRLLLSIPAPPGDAISVPVQQTYHPYTITWNWFEVDEDDIAGDVTALLTMLLHNQSGNGTTGLYLITNRVICGLRSTSRGADFTSHINLADEQNPAGITVSLLGVSTAWANDVEAPTGRRIAYAPALDETLGGAVRIALDDTIEPDFRGKFHAFLRCQQVGGSAGDISAALRIALWPNGPSAYDTDEQYTEHPGYWELLDLGRIQLPNYTVDDGELLSTLYIDILLSNSNAPTADLYLYDLILIPADEFFVSASDYVTSTKLSVQAHDYLDRIRIDSVYYPKRRIRSHAELVATSEMVQPFRSIAAQSAILQANTTQRMYTLIGTYPVLSPWPPHHPIEIASSVQLFATQRYFSMRGDR